MSRAPKRGAKVVLFPELAKHPAIYFTECHRRENFWAKSFAVSQKMCYFVAEKEKTRRGTYKNYIGIMKKNAGIILIVLGALLLILSYIADLMDYNWYQLICLLLIIGGIVTHIIVSKKAEQE